MNKKYLPSKQFILRIIAIAIILAIIFGIYSIVKYFQNKTSPENQKTELTVKDILTGAKDTNDNGIPDWEESLWGFNPITNGPENKTAILAKKQELSKANESSGQSDSQKAITANENLSQEFFALIMSLKESGNLNDTSLKSAADAFGSQIQPTPLPNAYTSNDQIIKISNSTDDVKNYLKSVNDLLLKHSDLGSELTLISNGTENSDATAFTLVDNVALSYISFSKELIKIPVPSKISTIVLSMANNYEKLGQSTMGLSKGSDDPIVAMKSLINYNNYNNALLIDTDNLSKNI